MPHLKIKTCNRIAIAIAGPHKGRRYILTGRLEWMPAGMASPQELREALTSTKQNGNTK